MSDTNLPLAPGAEGILSALAADPPPSTTAWLGVVLSRYGLMAEALTQGLDARAELQRINRSQGPAGVPAPRQTVLDGALKRAQARRRARVAEEDVVAAVLELAGFQVRAARASSSGMPAVATGSPTASAPAEGAGAAPAIAVPSANDPSSGRADPRTPTLDKFGNDLTAAAAAGKLNQVLGRDREVDAILETLCRRIKRNPLLVGPPGTGKTALVEAVAARVASGKVPGPLKGARIVALQASAIVSGGGIVGEIEKRMQGILQEAAQPGIILFIDEVHTIVGTGGREGTGDIASQLKPALARDNLVCIAATTDDEYRKFITKDGALERRFQAIRIRELTALETTEILRGLRDKAKADHNITVSDDVLRTVVSTVERALPNRYFPDKGIDLFDQLVAHAMLRGINAPDEDTVNTVASALYGMPTGAGNRIEVLDDLLRRSRLVPDDDRERILDRLAISLRGLDVRPERPNLTALLTGPAAQAMGRLGAVLSEGLYGEANRTVTVDCGSMQESHDVRILVGSPPGYVGYDDRHALMGVVERPCSVVMFDGLDKAHPAALDILLPALREGVVTDLQGRRIHFSESVVLVAWETVGEARSKVGFHQGGGDEPDEARAEGVPPSLLMAADVVLSGAAGRRSGSMVLDAIAARWTQKEGVQLEWDADLVAWALDAESELDDPEALAAWGDREVNLPLGRRLVADDARPGRYRVDRTSKGLSVTPVEPDAAQPPKPETPA